MQPSSKLFPSLAKLKQTSPNRWIACCPAHDDRSPSLAITELADGRLLIHCFAGCSAAEVLSSIGLGLQDLYPQDLQGSFKPVRGAFDSLQALRCIAFEAAVVLCAIVTRDLNAEDYERLMLAHERISDALTMVGGTQ